MSTSSLSTVIMAGCYERVLFGFELQMQGSSKAKLEQILMYPAHEGCVRAMASLGKLTASGSSDHLIKVYNMEKKVEICSLIKHEDMINCLEFYGDGHMLSGSEDGTISIWDTKSWECLITLIGHKSPVLSLSIHPTGKLALSVSKDSTLKMWNLVKGKCAFTSKLEKQLEKVLWSPSGNLYAIISTSGVTVYIASSGEEKISFPYKTRAIAMQFITEDVIAVGGEDKLVTLWDITNGNQIQELQGHSNRIKAISIIQKTKSNPMLLVTASSDGFIKLWLLNDQKLSSPAKLLDEVSTTARLTCMTTCHFQRNIADSAKQKRKEKTENEDEEDDDDDSKQKETEEKQAKKKQKLKVSFNF